MELIFAVVPLKTWIFAAGFGGLIQVLKTKYKNFSLTKEYEKNIKEIRNQYLYLIREDLKNNKDDYLKEELEKFNLEQFNEVIEKIYIDENFSSLITERVKNNINNMKFESHTSNFNILLIGPTGVGKSTLINSILKLDENNKAKTANGKPVTLGEPHPYISEKIPGIRLYDSRGIDKSGYNIENLLNSVTKLINDAAEKNDPDKFIHCIWYCITGHRFEEVERDSLIKLMKIYHDETLPIIIVYTQCISEDDSKSMEKEIKNICMEKNRKIEIISVLAENKEVGKKKKTIVEKYGIDELLEKSFEKIEGAVQSACFHSIRQQIKKNYEEKIKSFHQKIKEKVKNEIKGPFNENISLDNLAEKDLKLIEEISEILIFEGDDKKLSENSKNILLNFLKNFVGFCSEKLNEFMEKLVIKKSIELATSYHTKQEEIHHKKDEINKGFLNMVSNQIMDNISLFKTMGINSGKNDIKYKEMKQWQQISKDEISTEFQEKIGKYFNKGITKFIAGQFIAKITQSMIKSFNETFDNIDDYMVEKMGNQVKMISSEIIKKIIQILIKIIQI